MGELKEIIKTRKFSKLFAGETDDTFIQFFRYVFVGGLAFLLDYGVMTLLVEICGLNEVFAASVSFILGLVANYLLSTLWVFKSSNVSNRWIEFGIFAAIGVVGLGINAVIIWLFQDVMGAHMLLGSLIPQSKYYMIGKLVSTVVVFLWNFIARKMILYRKK